MAFAKLRLVKDRRPNQDLQAAIVTYATKSDGRLGPRSIPVRGAYLDVDAILARSLPRAFIRRRRVGLQRWRRDRSPK